jgi:hypothetical protein
MLHSVACHARPTTHDTNGHPSVLVLKSVDRDGVFGQAGLKKREMIVADQLPNELLEWLDDNRGQQVTLTIATGSIGVMTQPLEKYPQRQVSFVIP